MHLNKSGDIAYIARRLGSNAEVGDINYLSIGGVAERSKALVLKTSVLKGTQGSNPCPSAKYPYLDLVLVPIANPRIAKMKTSNPPGAGTGFGSVATVKMPESA
jgi:hypothetical protein